VFEIEVLGTQEVTVLWIKLHNSEVHNLYSLRNSLLLRNPKVHYHIYRSSPLEPIISQYNPFPIFMPYFSKIHF